MDKKEKLLIIFAVLNIAEEMGIEDDVLASEYQYNKLNETIKEVEMLFKDEGKEESKKFIIDTFRKYVDEL